MPNIKFVESTPTDAKPSHGGDLEWAAWRGKQPFSIPARIAVRNCGYVPPPDPGLHPVDDHEHHRADDDGMAPRGLDGEADSR